MKSNRSLLGTLVILIFYAGLFSQTAIEPATGDGSAANPYHIASLENLYWIAAADNVVSDPDQQTRWSSHYIQTADIEALETVNWFEGAGWPPVGKGSPLNEHFTGSYDGQGHRIENLTINRPEEEYCGLFGSIAEGAVIRNLGLVSVYVTGEIRVGGLVGTGFLSSIEDCYVTGTVNGELYTGGLAGSSFDMEFNNCYATVEVSGGNYYTGGLVGYLAASEIMMCHSEGSILATGSHAGGLVGKAIFDSVIRYSYSTADVSGHHFVGGLAGQNDDSTIINSYSTGNVSGYGSGTGGLVGNNTMGLILSCFSNSNVTGTYTTGGLVGLNSLNSLISNSYSTGKVECPMVTGGLVGANRYNSLIYRSYSNGSVTGDIITGGLAGENTFNSDAQWSYWDIETSGQSTSPCGTGRTTSEMTYPYQFPNTYVQWDFATVWASDTDHSLNNGYPYLYFYSEDLPFAIAPSAGDGSPVNPYQIDTIENLFWLSAGNEIVHSPDQATRLSKHYIQTADLDASESINWYNGDGWHPIGRDSNNEFSGTYDGAGFTINSLYINRPETDFIGLFGSVRGSSAQVSNLGLSDVEIIGRNHVGGIVGWSYQNSGLIGCFVTGEISGYNRVGGIAGQSLESVIHDCYSEVEVSGDLNVGGLAGVLNQSTVSNSYSSGVVLGFNDSAGGLAGLSTQNSEIRDSYSMAEVSGEDKVGGLVGGNRASSVILRSYSTGNVSGQERVGGLTGVLMENSSIIDCYSRGDAAGHSQVGGLIGFNGSGSVILNCFSTGQVSGEIETGGLIGGGMEQGVENSYWDMDTSGLDHSIAGEGRTTEEMTYPYAANTYINWNFSEIWAADTDHDTNDGYPYLLQKPVTAEEDILTPVYATKVSVYPNPFNPETTILLKLKGEDTGKPVTVAIYNLKGQRVKSILSNEIIGTESRKLIWKGTNENRRPVSSGIYLLRVETGSESVMRKMSLLK